MKPRPRCAGQATLATSPSSLLQGLLQLLALPLQPDSDAGGAALPAMGALADLLEHVLAQHRGERASEEEGEAEAEGTPGGGAATRCVWEGMTFACVEVCVQRNCMQGMLALSVHPPLCSYPLPLLGRPMEPEARRAFAAAALDVLLQQLQPFEGAFQAPPPGAACGAHVQPGTHSPQGVPDALRREAGGHVGRVWVWGCWTGTRH